MIILNESQPEKSLYVIGAFLVEKLRTYTESFYAVDLFVELESELEISFPQFLLTLDWLYLIGLLDTSDEGKLKKCF